MAASQMRHLNHSNNGSSSNNENSNSSGNANIIIRISTIIAHARFAVLDVGIALEMLYNLLLAKALACVNRFVETYGSFPQ